MEYLHSPKHKAPVLSYRGVNVKISVYQLFGIAALGHIVNII